MAHAPTVTGYTSNGGFVSEGIRQACHTVTAEIEATVTQGGGQLLTDCAKVTCVDLNNATRNVDLMAENGGTP